MNELVAGEHALRVEAAVTRLNGLLPLAARQRALDGKLRQLHRDILHSLAHTGRALNHAEMAERVPNVDVALTRLAADDLVVLDNQGRYVVGAYPMSVEDTPHQLQLNGIRVNAMCAVDALSVAPMFAVEVDIQSRCHVTGEPVHIVMQGDEVRQASPAELRVGVRWQDTKTCAAHSLCMEMVYLKDDATALAWQNGETDNISLFTLDEAVAFGCAFFLPLVSD